jgi:hypothetical protein
VSIRAEVDDLERRLAGAGKPALQPHEREQLRAMPAQQRQQIRDVLSQLNQGGPDLFRMFFLVFWVLSLSAFGIALVAALAERGARAIANGQFGTLALVLVPAIVVGLLLTHAIGAMMRAGRRMRQVAAATAEENTIDTIDDGLRKT